MQAAQIGETRRRQGERRSAANAAPRSSPHQPQSVRRPELPKVLGRSTPCGPIAAAPAVLEDGTILVASLSGVLFGLPKGQQRYSVDLGDRVYGAPLVQNESVFVGSDVHKFLRYRPRAEPFAFASIPTATSTPAQCPLLGAASSSPAARSCTRRNRTARCSGESTPDANASRPPQWPTTERSYVGSQDHHLYAMAPRRQIRWRVDLGARCRQRAGHRRRRDDRRRQRPR